MELKRAVFLDRDGTINEESGYLHRIEDCRFIPGAVNAVSALSAAGFLVIVVTNQSGIARGYYSEHDLDMLHKYMQQVVVTAGGSIQGWYHCPHHPDYRTDSSECNCRKPLPGMLLKAAEDFGIDLESSWMIGDKVADVDAGLKAGCRTIMVRTGYGEAESASVPAGTLIFADLAAAAKYIISNSLNGDQKCP
jgi:D-glycero-D-manno-heptose 1,7-bisphosphate phosphatase